MRNFVLILLFGVTILFSQETEPRRSPYRLDSKTDGIIFAGGLSVALSAIILDKNHSGPSISEINALDKKTINFFDRSFTGNYSVNQMALSDLAMYAAYVSPLLLLLDDGIREDWKTIGVLYLQMGLFSNFAPSIGKGSTKRFRPYVYGTNTPLPEKQDKDASRSFFSGHATRAFAAGVMTAVLYEDYYPHSVYKKYVWIASVGTASACAILRVSSGTHFPTDVIVGAIIGSGIGYFIPYIHRTRNDNLSVHPLFSPAGTGIGLAYRF
jgi:membrane-associated phospholipid phosphatase